MARAVPGTGATILGQRDYITRPGWKRLADELDTLWRVKRPHVVRELSAAAAEGDRSENAESMKEPLH